MYLQKVKSNKNFETQNNLFFVSQKGATGTPTTHHFAITTFLCVKFP
jgi:hypothetical protein